MDVKIQEQIIEELKVQATIDTRSEIARRVQFLRDHMLASGQHGLVLGISGGIDSTVAGRLAQLAAAAARDDGAERTRFIAMRLPYGVQGDEEDARLALEFIDPDHTLTVDIKPASDAALAELESGGLEFRDAGHRDFIHGNIKARQRMIAQYATAAGQGALVIGTDHAAEALMGFFTKHGDGACDLAPLTGLNKRQVRQLATALGAPQRLIEKPPTADLESLDPGKPDEDALGVHYDEIDDFLEGKPIATTSFERVLKTYYATEHKRAMPRAPIPITT